MWDRQIPLPFLNLVRPWFSSFSRNQMEMAFWPSGSDIYGIGQGMAKGKT